MPDKLFVDTSFVIALINEKDQYHNQAEALSYKFENSSLLTTGAVLLEIGNALAKDFREEAVRVINVLRTSKRVEVAEVDEKLSEKGLAVFEKYADKTWGLVDCISFVVMWEAGLIEVLTFDEDFEQAGIHHSECVIGQGRRARGAIALASESSREICSPVCPPRVCQRSSCLWTCLHREIRDVPDRSLFSCVSLESSAQVIHR